MYIPPLSIDCVYIAITSIGSLHTAVLEGWLFFMLTCTIFCPCILAAYHAISPHYSTTHPESIDKCAVTSNSESIRACILSFDHATYNYEGMRCALGSSPLFVYCHLWYTVSFVIGPTSMQTDVNTCARSYVDHTLVPNTRHWMIYLTNIIQTIQCWCFCQSLINVVPCTSVRNSSSL